MLGLLDFLLSLKRVDLRVRFVGVTEEEFDEFRHQSTEYDRSEADHDQGSAFDD